jgi:hypothetical protein
LRNNFLFIQAWTVNENVSRSFTACNDKPRCRGYEVPWSSLPKYAPFKEITFDTRTNYSFLKKHLPEKIAGGRWRFKDLEEVCNECRKDGLIAILSISLSNSSLSFPRATRPRQILAAIADHFTIILPNHRYLWYNNYFSRTYNSFKPLRLGHFDLRLGLRLITAMFGLDNSL